jgi:ubiquinone/menaquinone biosynthesis C-methylase UbiE
LEHIPTDIVAMKELRRVLKNGGQAILQVPISNNSSTTLEDFSITDPQKREVVFGQFDHVRIYGQDYVNRLQESGFKVKRVNLYKEYMKYGLNKDEDIFICEK